MKISEGSDTEARLLALKMEEGPLAKAGRQP